MCGTEPNQEQQQQPVRGGGFELLDSEMKSGENERSQLVEGERVVVVVDDGRWKCQIEKNKMLVYTTTTAAKQQQRN